MKITVVCVGKLKEKFFADGVEEYKKRLGRYAKIEIAEVADEKAPENLSRAEEEQVKVKEGEKILKKIPDDAFVVALCIDGKMLSSEELADFFEKKTVSGISSIAFVIGGSLGLSKEVIDRADYKLSFSKMTFPHQLMRMILMEQIYRAFRIIKNEPYHK
ncbi:MAG: 23S rRNA (pseudouridine(1915)-N(3))-methyltransferase RlmH [Firmicutes bacterium]|nr:23S rRNA (pseudouridine(1915)-N(3))-methyltransferase RlmH [Bacillota bacterium]